MTSRTSKLGRLALVVAAAAAAGAPAASADTPQEGPVLTAEVELYDAAGKLLREYDCTWTTAPDTDECFFVVADGPDRVDFLKRAGAARALTVTRSSDGALEGHGELEQRSDGRWYYRGSSKGSLGQLPARERQFGFVADPTGRTWVPWEVSDRPSSGGMARASNARAAVRKAKAKLARKAKGRRSKAQRAGR